jgi:hypothetical protein
MEVVIDYETVKRAHGEDTVKKLSVASDNVHETFRFHPSYPMEKHSEEFNGLNWNGGIIEYAKLFQTVNEVPANFAHLYGKGTAQTRFLSTQVGRAVLNLDTFSCPERNSFVMGTVCTIPCHCFPDKSCASRNAHALYEWLTFHLKEKSYVKCPKDRSLHTAIFNSGVRLL